MTDSTEEVIGRYQVLENLASGSQGTVYHAYDPELEREVALKVLHPHLTTEDIVARFQREARIVASINHTNIAGITDIGEHEGAHFIAIEYVPHTARELIDQGPLDITRAVTVGYQAALALEAARTSRRGITHHDIKPENLLLTTLDDEGVVKLIDFGIAHAADMAPMTQAGSQWGTPYYMPPEQWQGERGDTRSDVYSLGVVIYQMLTGQVPFSSTAASSMAQNNEIAQQHIEVDPTSLRSIREDVPEALESIVLKCMAKSPDDRYQTPGELAEELAGILGVAPTPSASLPVSRPPSRPPDDEKRGLRIPLPLIAAGGFGALILVVLVALLIVRPDDGPGENGTGRPPPAARTSDDSSVPGRSPSSGAAGGPVGNLLDRSEPTPTPEPSPTEVKDISVAVEEAVAKALATAIPPTPTSPPVTPTPTHTPSPTPTNTPSPTPTNTPSPTPTNTPSPTPTHTPLPTPTNTPLPTPTFTPSPTPTNTPLPTPTFTPSPTPTSTPVPALPALSIEDAWISNADPAIWEEVRVSVTVSNQGEATADEFHVELVDNDTWESLGKRVKVVELAPGETRDLSMVWRAEVEPRTLGLDLDSPYAEDEILPLPSFEPFIPPYVIEQITWHPEHPAIDEDVTFWAHIKNTSPRSSEYDADVTFYLNGEYYSSTMLDRRLNRNVVRTIRSDDWRAQKGSYEILAVLYPSAYLDHRENSSWDEYDERYAISEYDVTYDATRLPNLAVTKMEFLERPVADADAVYLDLFVTITNDLGDGGITPSVDDTFDVRIEFEEGPLCPIRPGRIPCSEDIQIRGLRGGSTVTKQVEGTVLFPLPPSGSVLKFTAIVTVDPSNEVEELTKDDNHKPRVHRVTR